MKITKDIIDRIIKEETQRLHEADIVDLSQVRQQKETEAQEQGLRDIEESIESVEDMLAGVAANMLDVVRAINNSQHVNDFKTKHPGKIEALELVWDMIADWSYEMYPKTPEDIARKKAAMTQMPGEDIEATGEYPPPEDVYQDDYEWTPEEYEEYKARRGPIAPEDEDV